MAASNLEMLKFRIFVFLVGCVIHGRTRNAEIISELPYHSCLGGNFTPQSGYQSNLNILFTNLSNISLHAKFYNTSIGETANDTVYGLFQCQGDIVSGKCQACVAIASRETAQQNCAFRKRAVAWYQECLLRYSDQSFFSVVDTTPTLMLPTVDDISVDNARFNQLVVSTLRLTAASAANATSLGQFFATQDANFTSNITLYTLAQCTGDLSNVNCLRCLTQTIDLIPNCCTNKQGGTVLFPSCYVRYDVDPLYQEDPVLVLGPGEPAVSMVKNRSSTPIATIVAIVVPNSLSILLFLGWYFWRRRTKTRKYTRNGDAAVDGMTHVESLQFDFNTIDVATNKFAVENKLGEGGFGPVYKGRLDDGQEIAVKRLSRGSLQGAEEFKNEVMVVAKLQHRNLVRLLGFCLESEEKILVYEYIPNKSLDYFLFDPEGQKELDWCGRYKIINEIARGILYLHEDSRLRIIHRDLKASNVLLDENMNPKISDFGMARIIQMDQTEGNTRRIVGTYGYMSPEYAMHGNFSTKSDVYSYGVLVLEIISGKKNSIFYQTNLDQSILNYTWNLWKNGTTLELLDSSLGDNYSRNEVLRCIHIALLCVQENPVRRPSMASIVLMLNSYSIPLAAPKEPAFLLRSANNSTITNQDHSMNRCILWSNNEMSISQLHPR